MVTSYRKNRLSQVKQEELIKYFVGGQTAYSAAALAKVHKNTAALYFYKIRQIIANHLDKEAENLFLDEGVEIDESYFGGVRKGKRGRGAAMLS